LWEGTLREQSNALLFLEFNSDARPRKPRWTLVSSKKAQISRCLLRFSYYKHFVQIRWRIALAWAINLAVMKQTNFYKVAIQEELAKRCEKNPRYSLRAFAKALELEPGVLSLILSGKKTPSFKTAQLILARLDLEPEQIQDFLSSLAQAHKSRGMKRLSPHFKKMAIRPTIPDLSIDLFRVIGDWYHYAILMLTFIEGFKNDSNWIAVQLRISPSEAKLAVDRLMNLELLIEKDGKLIAQEGYSLADKTISTVSLRKHQQQVLEKAIVSLQNDSIDDRSMTSFTMAIDPEKIPEAKKLIERFTNEMSALMEGGRRLQVYQLGVALYPLQIKKEEK
jgi:uncharacterized protein (TIGR02147 family)